jgi:hypothetical protein
VKTQTDALWSCIRAAGCSWIMAAELGPFAADPKRIAERSIDQNPSRITDFFSQTRSGAPIAVLTRGHCTPLPSP